MTPEGKVKKSVKKILDAVGDDLWYFMPSANGYGRAGVPDFVGCFKGFFFAIECKAGKGTLTTLQRHEMEVIDTAGGTFWLVDDTTVDAFGGYFTYWCADKNGG